MSVQDIMSEELSELLNASVLEEVTNVDYTAELEGGNHLFYICPTIIIDEGSMPTAVYGVYNRETGIRETEARQYAAAKMWVDALTEKEDALTVGDLPGLGADIKPDPTGQVH